MCEDILMKGLKACRQLKETKFKIPGVGVGIPPGIAAHDIRYM